MKLRKPYVTRRNETAAQAQKKWLQFYDNPPGYQVKNKRGQFLGDIVKSRGAWRFYPDDSQLTMWFTADCLRELAAFMEGRL